MSELIDDSSCCDDLLSSHERTVIEFDNCKLLASEVRLEDTQHSAIKYKIECSYAGFREPDASPEELIAFFLSTHCPSNSHLGENIIRLSEDQLVHWLQIRNDYIAILKCFVILQTDPEPSTSKFNSKTDPFDEWAYNQIWSYARTLNLLYGVLHHAWPKFKLVFERLSQEEALSQYFEDFADLENPYELFVEIVQEAAELDFQKCFQPFFEDKASEYGRLVTLKRREFGKVSRPKSKDSASQLPRFLSSDEKVELRQLLTEYRLQSQPLFIRFQVAWELLALRDPQASEQLHRYVALCDEIWAQEQDATHKPELKAHRPSETWYRGKKRVNQRGPYKKYGTDP
jgi:hypothetical protein